MNSRLCFIALTSLALIGLHVSAQATMRTWTGAGSNNLWTNATNWGGSAPVAGDHLVFPPGNTQLLNTNNFPNGTTFQAITFTGTNYSVGGNAVVLNAGITNNAASAGNNLFYCPITLASNQTFACVGSASSVLALNGGITNNGNMLTFVGITFTISGIISGEGGLESSAGQLVLAGANTYSGLTIISSGFAIVNNGLAFGAAGAGTIVSNFGTILIQNNVSVPEPLTLSGKLLNSSGTNTMTGDIVFMSASCTVDVRTNSLLNFSNALKGVGGLLKTNTGTLRLAGSSNNTYLGTTTVNAGALLLNKSPGTNAIPGALMIGDGVGGANADVVRLLAANQIANAAAVTISASGLLDLNNNGDALGSFAGSGTIVLGSGVITNGGNNLNTDFGGAISGTAGSRFYKQGVFMALSGNSGTTFLGETIIQDGILRVNGSIANSPVTILPTGILTGTGSVGTITMISNGQLSPGASPATGVMNSSNVTLHADGYFTVELNGTNAGTDYDQLNVSGSVNLAGVLLAGTVGFTPAIGDTFKVINNDGADPVVGAFDSVTNGATVGVGGIPFQIFYNGGDGNDVVLTRIRPASIIVSVERLESGIVEITGSGIGLVNYLLEASTNLLDWEELHVEQSSSDGGYILPDVNAAQFPLRFYRVATP